MFGLTRREQRWAAEQKAAETLVSLVTAMVQADATVSAAKAAVDCRTTHHPTHQGANTMSTQAMQDVIAERRRQMTVEGWVSQHDDEHIDGSLAAAAACYALHAYNESAIQSGYIPWRNQALDGDPEHWPYSWDTSWWKPKDRRRNLVRAAALLIAEIERLDRATKEPTP